jgi:hypothetical protein
MIFYEFFRILFSYFRGLKLKQKKNVLEKKIGWAGQPTHARLCTSHSGQASRQRRKAPHTLPAFSRQKKSSPTRGARGYLQPTVKETSSRTGNKTASKFRFLARFGPDFLALGQENSPINTP